MDHPVFYEDEVDIHSIPSWGGLDDAREAEESGNLGQNRKHYLTLAPCMPEQVT